LKQAYDYWQNQPDLNWRGHGAHKQAQASLYAPIGVGFDHVLRLILKKSVVSTGLCDI